MTEEFESVELEYSEDDILYYIMDEDDNEIGFALEEDGQEVEYYYEGFDANDYEVVEEHVADQPVTSSAKGVVEPKADSAVVDAEPAGTAKPAASAKPAEPVEHGYLYKLAQIAGHEGNKARKKAGAQLGKAREKAEPIVDKARAKAEQGVDKATEAVETGGKKLKEKKDEYDLGITRENVTEATADLNAIAKEGAATAKELKETYDDIMDSFGFLVPKGIRRKLP